MCKNSIRVPGELNKCGKQHGPDEPGNEARLCFLAKMVAVLKEVQESTLALHSRRSNLHGSQGFFIYLDYTPVLPGRHGPVHLALPYLLGYY
jgi:hypothetical protein